MLVHEIAHQWFYGMVGNSQFRDPWLDEAFATYAEATVEPRSAEFLAGALGLPGEVGGSMAEFEGRPASTSTSSTARAGPRCWPPARPSAPEAFDAALRCYIDANAWSVATPADVAVALADLPEALVVLGQAQAVAKDDVPARTG